MDDPVLPICKFDVSRLPETGGNWELVANENEREAIAEFAGMSALEELRASFRATPFGHAGATVLGQIEAVAVQPCTVTLEPVRQHISASFEQLYLPGRSADRRSDKEELVLDAFEDDPPERYAGPLDLWQMAIETLILNFDPFPRADDADSHLAGASDEKEPPSDESPFSALAALKKDHKTGR
jgi:uncharacterized metal-binding protein YceD (DUF177 family)